MRAEQVFVGSLDLTAVHSVCQRVEVLSEEEKRGRLLDFLTNELGEDDKVIVFMARKCAVDNVTAEFALTDIRCQSIHGGREQYDREQVCVYWVCADCCFRNWSKDRLFESVELPI